MTHVYNSFLILACVQSRTRNVLFGDPCHDSDQGMDLVSSLSKSVKRSRNYRANLGALCDWSIFSFLVIVFDCLVGAPSSPNLSCYKTSTLSFVFIESLLNVIFILAPTHWQSCPRTHPLYLRLALQLQLAGLHWRPEWVGDRVSLYIGGCRWK